ncbi:MAG: WD40 repeat domain-containing protein [Gemmataceae bacterium]|nr:WD40 repeat domain-containing protein [Gemmataceae bacterium]
MSRPHVLPHLTASLALVLASSVHWADGPNPSKDQHGLPLPSGAVARFGRAEMWRTGQVRALAFTPDNKSVALALRWPAEQYLCLINLATGREVCAFWGWDGWVGQFAFSPDGKTLAAATTTEVYLWDITKPDTPRTLKGHPKGLGSLAFSPDGRLLAAAGGWFSDSKDQAVRLWDVATGKELRRLEGHATAAVALSFSPDGRRLVAVSPDENSEKGKPPVRWGRLCVWEVASGQEVLARAVKTSCASLAFSPAGRVLACGSGPTRQDDEKGAVLWDLDNMQELARLQGHDATVDCLAFTPDSKALVTGSADRTALLWGVPRVPRQVVAERLSAQALEGLWADLAGEAPRAWRAVTRLSASPAEAVRFLGERLRPEPGVDANRLKQLVIDLDSARFAVRQRAAVELERLGELAEPALRQTLQGEGSLEYRRRVELLLQKVETPVLVPERVRRLRALAVLERSGSPEAVRLLQTLARGASEAQLTSQARAALSRLAARQEAGKG